MAGSSHDGEGLGFQPIRIACVITQEIGTPRNDGTRGCSLYSVPFKLSQQPPHEWAQFFIQAWNHPAEFTSMHRPGIASVLGDKVILDGTTIEEIEQYHRRTLMLALEEANRRYQQFETEQKERLRVAQERIKEHKRKVEESAKQLKFD